MKRFLAVVLAVALAVTGCSKVDSAATVGDQEIALSDLQSQVDLILKEREVLIPHRCSLKLAKL